jgi:hypothetical protein
MNQLQIKQQKSQEHQMGKEKEDKHKTWTAMTYPRYLDAGWNRMHYCRHPVEPRND